MELSMELFAEICRPAILSSVLPAGCADLKETAGRRLPDGRARGILNGARLSRARPPGGSGGCGKKSARTLSFCAEGAPPWPTAN